MKRRTLLHNLFSSIVAVPVFGAYQLGRHESFPVLVEADDERYMRRAISIAGNNPKYPFGALLVDDAKGVVAVANNWGGHGVPPLQINPVNHQFFSNSNRPARVVSLPGRQDCTFS